MAKYIALVAGKKKEITPITTSSGAGDAAKIPQTDGSGRLDMSIMPLGLTAETKTITASENLDPGNFVNLHNSTGLKIRKADASNGRRADGFVIAAVTSGQPATVYYGNLNTALSGLTAGTEYWLDAAGGVTATPPSTGGHISQYLGKGTDTGEMLVEIGEPVELA